MGKIDQLFGKPAKALHLDDFRALVSRKISESPTLDFKREAYEDGKEIAKDVTAMANADGGLILIGMDEEGGFASACIPQPLNDQDELRMLQWVESLVLPALDVRIQLIRDPTDSSRAVCVLEVSPGNQPHGTPKVGGSRFYLRRGTQNQPLDALGVFSLHEEKRKVPARAATRLDEVRKIAIQHLALHDSAPVWVGVDLVPLRASDVVVDSARGKALEAFAKAACSKLTRGTAAFPIQATFDSRRIEIAPWDFRNRQPVHYVLQFHADGAISIDTELFCADQLLPGDFGFPDDKPPPGSCIFSDELTLQTGRLIRAAIACSRELASASGAAALQTSIFAHARPLAIGYAQYKWEARSWARYQQSRVLEIGEHVHEQPIQLSLEGVASSPQELMQTTRTALTGLFHAFGLPEVLAIDRAGSLNLTHLSLLQAPYWDIAESVQRVEVDPFSR